jgi:hypothetical protein
MITPYSIIFSEINNGVFAPRWISRKASGGVIYFVGVTDA